MKRSNRPAWQTRAAGAAAAAVGLVFCLASARAADDRLVLLDGDQHSAAVRAIGADGRVELEGADERLDLQSLRVIERPDVHVAAVKAPLAVYLAGGGMLAATTAVVREENCLIDWSHGKELALPIDSIRAIRFGADLPEKNRPKGSEAFDQALAAPADEHDQLFAILDDRVQVITGVFEGLSADQVAFAWKDGSQSIARNKIYALAIAPLGKAQRHTGQCLIELADGSSMWTTLVKLDAGQLSFQIANTPVAVPWDAVARITITNDRLAFLSDLEPVEVAEQPLLTAARPWRRDKSVLERPLKLADKTYQKGLGVHSRSLLAFANDGYDLLAATIGIDAETAGKGDCVFIVSADGRELFNQRIKGTDKPVDLRLEISGSKRITLLVEPGEDLDLGDHADWCDARLIRDEKR